MKSLHLQIITPKKVVKDIKVERVTVPTVTGEITILFNHAHLFSQLQEGIVSYVFNNQQEFLAIGGGYVQTDGEEVKLIVSKAYGQDEIDKEEIEKAVTQAQKLKQGAKTENERKEAAAILRRSIIDRKLLKKKAPKTLRSS